MKPGGATTSHLYFQLLAALGAALVLVLGACQLPLPTVQRQALITPDMNFIKYRWVELDTFIAFSID